MTVRRGEPWGALAVPPPNAEVVRGNRALFSAINSGTHAGPLVAIGCDIARTCGVINAEPPDGSPRPHVTIDLLRVESDHDEFLCAAHCLFTASPFRSPPHVWHRWWRFGITIVMNAQFIGSADLAPRGHPNDGRADVITVDRAMTARQRVLAWRRTPLGSHVPHPLIDERRVTSTAFDFAKPQYVTADGVDRGVTRRARISVMPDALSLYV